MKIDKIKEISANISEIKLENGFKIIYYEDPEFESYYVEMTTKYGSIDFSYLKNDKPIQHNPGIAHFLEHVMFNMPYGDALSKFNELLGSANAYTSYERTSYLVKFSENILENIKTLLELCTNLHIDEKKVEKEKGIILEEIGLYDKDPEWSIFKNSLNNSLKNIKYKYDILGSKEDVSTMTYEMLKEAFEDFYRPDNQYIVIIGPKLDEVVKEVIAFMEPKENKECKISKVKLKEELEIKDLEFIKEEEVAQEYLNISHKYVFDKLDDSYENSLNLELCLELVYTLFNENYIKAEEERIIDYTFEYDSIMFSNVILLMFFGVNQKEDILEDFLEKENINNHAGKYKENLIKHKQGMLLKNFDDEVRLGKFLNMLEQKEISVEKYYEFLEKFEINKVKEILNQGKKIKIVNKIKSKA